MPPAVAAAMPNGASSKTTQFIGFTLNNLAAFKNTSGAGFPLSTSSPDTSTVKACVKPNRLTTISIISFGEEDATAREYLWV